MAVNPIIERARAHFTEQLNNEMQSIEVPEWDATIYWRPFTGKQRERVLALLSDKKIVGAAVEQIVLRSLDADGNRLFRDADRTLFMNHIDPEIVDRIATAMAGLEPDIGDDDLKD